MERTPLFARRGQWDAARAADIETAGCFRSLESGLGPVWTNLRT